MKNPENKDNNYLPSEKELCVLRQYVEDSAYIQYIHDFNGGYYYQNSLQLYSILEKENSSGLFNINSFISNTYLNIFYDMFSFGQDTFGNQFCFSKTGEIYLFNIETGESEYLAESFPSWHTLLLHDLEYLTGIKLRRNFISETSIDIKYSDRLCPKVPFVVGGEFNSANLYNVSTLECLSINSNIAKQVFNLPDGASIVLKTTD